MSHYYVGETSAVPLGFIVNLPLIVKYSPHKPSIYGHAEFILNQNDLCSALLLKALAK